MAQEEIIQQLHAAVQAYQCRDLDGAELIFKRMLSLNPKDPHALHFLGCIHKDRGQLQQAVDLIQASIREDSTNPIPFLNLGKILASAGQHEKAISVFQQSLKRHQQIPDTWFCFGNSLKSIGKIAEAKQAYLSALQLNPVHSGSLSNLVPLLTEKAEFEDAKQLFSTALEQSPNDVTLRINFGALLSQDNDYASAILQYQIALPFAPRSPELHYNFARALKEFGEVDQAILHYRKATELNPNFVDAFLNLGDALKEVGKTEAAIINYRKVILLKPDFFDAYLKLGYSLIKAGSLDEVRDLISSLRENLPFNPDALVPFKDKTLVFDWNHRRLLDLAWEVERVASSIGSPSLLHAVEQVDALCFPPLFLENIDSPGKGRALYQTGFLVDDALVSPSMCANLISTFNKGTCVMSDQFIESALARDVFLSVLKKIELHTGFPHLIWNCVYLAKRSTDRAVNDVWHFDNHYNRWTPKLMIYLNSQRDEGGATHFVDATLSRRLSSKSDYLGLLFQRESYQEIVLSLVDELSLNPVTLDPDHFVFSPKKAGTGIWFCPSRSLHRGVSPRKGVRHVLSFSLTPLPADCGLSIDQCLEKSVNILSDKIKNGMQKFDVNPYWMSAFSSPD